ITDDYCDCKVPEGLFSLPETKKSLKPMILKDVDAINQRQNTLLQTITAIVKFQKDYFHYRRRKSL
ncbi:hypothetical protein, partial [Chryseobacterium sp. CH1]|uniref:hypothetical protein n=1 Tax=Chryseobacterium sp. CH1 TaxID=713551 RepID=UPI001E3876D5